MLIRRCLTLLAVYAFCLTEAYAQGLKQCPNDALLAKAEEAYQDQRYEEAKVLLQWKFGRDCEKIAAMELRLRLMQAAPGIAPKALRDARRLDLAARILAVDSTNAFANFEAGQQAADMFLAWRHALRPALSGDDMEAFLGLDEMPFPERREHYALHRPTAPRDRNSGLENFANLNARDRFDVATLQQRGVSFIDMSDQAEEAFARAVHHIGRVLRSEPGSREAVEILLRLYAAHEDWPRMLETAESARSIQPDNPIPLFAHGIAAYQFQDLEGASAAFEAALDMDSTAAAAFTDLSLVLSPEEVESYVRDPEGYALRFWRLRDPRLLTNVNERRVEHYVRLAYADLLFAAPGLGMRGWETDRGRLYIRYGPPRAEYVFPFRFYPSDGGGRTHVWDYADFRFAFEDTGSLNEFSLFAPPAYAYVNPRADLSSQEFAARARERINKEPDRSQYAPPRHVPMPRMSSAFKGDGAKTDVYVVFGVPVAERPETGPLPLELRTGVFVLDDTGRTVAEVRSSPSTLPRPQILALPQATLYTEAPLLAVPPGTYSLVAEFDAVMGSVAGYASGPLSVPDFTHGGLRLSELLLAYGVEEGGVNAGIAHTIRRNGYEILPAPWAFFTRQQALYVYFETYGLTPEAAGGSQLDVEAILVPSEERGNLRRLWDTIRRAEPARGVSVAFEHGARGLDQGQYLLLDLSDQPPGEYVLALRVRQGGLEAEAQREIVLE